MNETGALWRPESGIWLPVVNRYEKHPAELVSLVQTKQLRNIELNILLI